MQTYPLSLKIAFVDPTKPTPTAFSWNLIAFIEAHFPVQISSPEEANYLVYGDFGVEHQNYQGIKIFYTGENHQARWIETDYALTHERVENGRHTRIPYWMYDFLMEGKETEMLLRHRPLLTLDNLGQQKRKFANFVYRNHVCKKRNQFFKRLNQYKRVDAAGSWLNNMEGNWTVPRGWENNQAFTSQYKFTISFENESHPGYTTEKITHPLIGRSLPIYWGNPHVAEDFNPAAYLNYLDYAKEQDLIDHIIAIDQDDTLLLPYLNAPALHHEGLIQEYRDKLIVMLTRIFSDAQQQRSGWEHKLFQLDRAMGRSALKRYKAWKRSRRNKD